MYYDLEILIRRLRKNMCNFSTNEDGKHVTTIEDVIEYLQYLIDDDNFLDDDDAFLDDDNEYEYE